MKTVNLDDLITEALLNNKSQAIIGKTIIDLSLMYKPKRYSVNVTTSKGGHCGVGSGVHVNMEAVKSAIRASWLKIDKSELPEDTIPPVRTWYVQIRGGEHYPFCQSAYHPNMDDFIVEDPNTGEKEYFFNIPHKLAPALDYPRQGDDIFIPVLDTWGISDYPPSIRKGN